MKKIPISIAIMMLAVLSTFATDMSLNGKWMFKTDYYNTGDRDEWFSPTADTAGWDTMDVPGCWNTRREYSTYTGTAWYRTSFTCDNPDGDDLILTFEAVYGDAEVWLNGHRLGSHDFGFTSFRFDITSLVKPGEMNTLAVKADNKFKIGATWNWGGIRRPVTIQRLPSKRIERIAVVATPDLKRKGAEIMVTTDLHNVTKGNLVLKIKDADGNVVATKKDRIHAGASNQTVSCTLKNANLWGLDTPYLYEAEVSLEDDGKPIHAVNSRFGIRKIEVDGYQLLLNGESVRLNGANYVPEDRFTGTTLPADLYKKDIDLMKECGVNMARLSHQGLPQEVLDYIDEKGMLIFEEIPLWNRNKLVDPDNTTPKRWLTELITQRYNHPCIIGWSVGNEIGRYNDNPMIYEYIASAIKHVRSLDSTRLAIYVTHTAARQDNEPAELSDIIMFNQYGAGGFQGKRAEIAHGYYPSKPIFYAEYGHKINSDDPDNDTTDFAGLAEGMRGYEYLIGASIWTYNDYRTNYRDNATAATQNRPWGVVDVYRNKKRGYEKLQRENSPVRNLTLTASADAGMINGEIKFTPRGHLDLPSYDMRGYILKVSALNKDSKVTVTEVIKLPEIKPGSEDRNFSFSLNITEATRVKVDLISPTGYTVDTRSRSLENPQAPTISHIEAAQYKIRIHYDRQPSTTQWYARYGTEKPDSKTALTINDFIEIGNLEFGKEYSVRLVAVNDHGETEATEDVKITTLAAELPPVICHLERAKDGIHVGILSENLDFIYEIEYGSDRDNMTERQMTTEMGSFILPDIEGNDLYLRARRRINYGYESQWSKTYHITRK